MNPNPTNSLQEPKKKKKLSRKTNGGFYFNYTISQWSFDSELLESMPLDHWDRIEV